jgi:hypothetical protein
MFFPPKIGETVRITADRGPGYAKKGSELAVERVLRYESPAMAGYYCVKLAGKYYDYCYWKKIGLLSKLMRKIDRIRPVIKF